MRDPNEIRRDLDQARGDLEHHVEELEHVIEGELEKPKHMLEEARHVVATAKKPLEWLEHHAVIATMGALVLGAAIRMLQLALRPRQKSRWLLHD
ncbi:MAG TPA: hypothetical protein VGL61_07240 [Kofleriaceae bacterium]|jgi:preprotein translocase subunit Sss1